MSAKRPGRKRARGVALASPGEEQFARRSARPAWHQHRRAQPGRRGARCPRTEPDGQASPGACVNVSSTASVPAASRHHGVSVLSRREAQARRPAGAIPATGPARAARQPPAPPAPVSQRARGRSLAARTSAARRTGPYRWVVQARRPLLCSCRSPAARAPPPVRGLRPGQRADQRYFLIPPTHKPLLRQKHREHSFSLARQPGAASLANLAAQRLTHPRSQRAPVVVEPLKHGLGRAEAGAERLQFPILLVALPDMAAARNPRSPGKLPAAVHPFRPRHSYSASVIEAASPSGHKPVAVPGSARRKGRSRQRSPGRPPCGRPARAPNSSITTALQSSRRLIAACTAARCSCRSLKVEPRNILNILARAAPNRNQRHDSADTGRR